VRTAFVLLLAAAFAFPAQAQTVAPQAREQALAQRKLERTRAQIQALAQERRKLEAQRNQALGSLRQADTQVSEAQRSLRDTDARIAAQASELARLEGQRATLEAGLSQQRAALARLARSAYLLGERAPLKLLLEQRRVADAARILAYHRYFQRERQRRVAELSGQLRSLAELAERIEADKRSLADARQRQGRELAALAAQHREREGAVAALNASYRDRGARLSALGRDEKDTVALLERLRKLMARSAKAPVSVRKPGGGSPRKPTDAAIPTGPMNLPLNGSVLAGYGGIMPDGHASKGLLIAGSAGTEVHAVAAGRVAYAEWLKGYGLLMILDHGSGWMTLYAFNDALLKKAGDAVRAGEAISTVGSSGGQGRPALYFELRRNGQPQDPKAWLRK